MPDHSANINLLPHKEESFVVQFLNWALTVGRFLVIVTETAALVTFLYRFTLDRQIIDLHDKIKYQQTIVENLAGNEKLYRGLQNSLTTAKTLDSESTVGSKLFSDVVNMARGNVQFSNLIISASSIKMSVNAFSVQSLSAFIDKLKADKDIASISLDQIQNSTTNAVISVTITAVLKGSEPKPALGINSH